jgi:hypothetical protein
MGKALLGVAKAASLAFLGFETLKGAVKFLDNVNTSTAALGRNAANIGGSAHDVQMYGLAIEQVGGKAEEATQTFAEFSREATNLKLRGEVGPMLQLFQNIGLAIRDSKGQLKDFNTLFQEAGKSLHERFPNRADAYNLATQSGISEGVFNLLYDPNQQKILQDADRAAFADAEKIRVAQEMQRRKNALGQKIKGAASSFGLNAEGTALDFLEHPKQTFGEVGDFYKELFDSGSKAFLDLIGNPAGRSIRNNNPGNIKAVGNQARDAQGFRIFSSLLEGEAALSSQLDRYASGQTTGKRVNTIRDIVATYEGKDGPGNHNDIEAYIKALMKATGRGADEQLTHEDRFKLIDAIEQHEDAKGYKQLQHAKALAAAHESGSSGSGNTTKVTVGTVNLNVPPGTDGPALAGSFMDSLNRIASNSQANTGITP